LNRKEEVDNYEDYYKRHWSNIDRLKRVDKVPRPDVRGAAFPRDVKNNPPVLVPFRTPPYSPERIVTIGPEEPLGGLISGTLNFSSDFARDLMERGYKDAVEVIHTYWPNPVN
jgi:hypothetical protein